MISAKGKGQSVGCHFSLCPLHFSLCTWRFSLLADVPPRHFLIWSPHHASPRRPPPPPVIRHPPRSHPHPRPPDTPGRGIEAKCAHSFGGDTVERNAPGVNASFQPPALDAKTETIAAQELSCAPRLRRSSAPPRSTNTAYLTAGSGTPAQRVTSDGQSRRGWNCRSSSSRRSWPSIQANTRAREGMWAAIARASATATTRPGMWRSIM